MSQQLWLGTAKVDITPATPVPLAGFAFRKGSFEGITRPLYAKVSLFQQPLIDGPGKRTLLVIQADLIALSADVLPWFSEELERRWGLGGADVLYSATHTHSGPHMRIGALGSRVDNGYVQMISASLLEAVENAFASLERVTVKKGLGHCGIGIHRRKEVEGKFQMAPNPEGPNDQEVTVVKFTRVSDGTVKNLLVHFTCHPTTTGDNLVSSEFPGVAMDKVEATLGGDVVAIFLQGCCGDIRPNLTKEGSFFRGDDTDVVVRGLELAESVLDVLDRPMKPLAVGGLETREKTIRLPFQRVPQEAELKAGAELPDHEGELNRRWLAIPPEERAYMPMRLVYMKLAEGLGLLSMNGEVVVQYGLYLKEQFPDHVLPMGYSNGIIAYIPTAEQLREGGYEPWESTPYFGMPSPFSEAIEPLIREAAVGLVRGAEVSQP